MEGEKTKRVRRNAEQLRADKIAAVEEKIKNHEEAIKELKLKLEELKRPPVLSKAEKRALFKKKIEDGVLTEEEAYQLGYDG